MTIVETSTEADQNLAILPSINWAEQDPVLREMWLRNETCEAIAESLGRSTAAIMTRAARLGLPRRSAPGRKSGYKRTEGLPKARPQKRQEHQDVSVHDHGKDSAGFRNTQPVAAQRVCLMCLNKFQSQGAHNRICPVCKGSSQYVAASSLPEMTFKVEH